MSSSSINNLNGGMEKSTKAIVLLLIMVLVCGVSLVIYLAVANTYATPASTTPSTTTPAATTPASTTPSTATPAATTPAATTPKPTVPGTTPVTPPAAPPPATTPPPAAPIPVGPPAITGGAIATCGSGTCASASSQTSWMWCNKCGCIWFPWGSKTCYAGGQHNAAGSGTYKIPTVNVPQDASQAGWKSCNKCSTLVFTFASGGAMASGNASLMAMANMGLLPSSGPGVCSDRKQHNFDGSSDYFPCTANNHNQCNWAWCKKCSSMYFTSGASMCYDGQAHDPSDSTNYQLVNT